MTTNDERATSTPAVDASLETPKTADDAAQNAASQPSSTSDTGNAANSEASVSASAPAAGGSIEQETAPPGTEKPVAATTEPDQPAAISPSPAAEPSALPETSSEPEGDGASAEGKAASDASAPEGDGASADAKAASDASEPEGDGASAEGKADGASGDEKKKRRRRRKRKKKKPEGEASDGAKASKGQKKLERPGFNLGDEVFGRVVAIKDDALHIDVAGKSNGIFPREELIAVPPVEGAQFIAKVKSASARGGWLMLGREPWDGAQSRAELREALENKTLVSCWITGLVKGGVEVDYKGVRAFAPASHVDVNPNADLTPLLGTQLQFAISHYGKKGRDVVVSRKESIEREYLEKRAVQLEKLSADMEVKARVRNVASWGVFVTLPDYDDIEGVIHMTEASHDRGAKLGSIFRKGSTVDVKVLRIDDKSKLWLSRKAMVTDPWEAAAAKYARGTRHQAKVVRLTEFGAFIQLEPGIDGLCHVADISFKVVKHPNEVVEVGQSMEVLVVNCDTENRKIGLHPAPPADESSDKPVNVAMHAKLEVVVTQIHERGLGVRIVGATGRRARGFIPAAQSGAARGAELRKHFPLGTKLTAKVVDLDRRRGEARMSVRALKTDEEKRAYRDYRKKVQKEGSFGTFADLFKKLEK